jgi:hypothetical protein
MIPGLPALLMWASVAAGAPPVSFTAAQEEHRAGLAEYRRLWEAEGPRIVAAMEAATGVAYPHSPIEMIVYGGTPMTSFDGRSIWLRASYPEDYKRATLVHEVGHRLAFALPRDEDLDDHRLLYLFLYDVWTDLYGQSFADRMVRIERRITGRYDYDAAWTWALSMTRAERQARLRALRERTAPAG